MTKFTRRSTWRLLGCGAMAALAVSLAYPIFAQGGDSSSSQVKKLTRIPAHALQCQIKKVSIEADGRLSAEVTLKNSLRTPLYFYRNQVADQIRLGLRVFPTEVKVVRAIMNPDEGSYFVGVRRGPDPLSRMEGGSEETFSISWSPGCDGPYVWCERPLGLEEIWQPVAKAQCPVDCSERQPGTGNAPEPLVVHPAGRAAVTLSFQIRVWPEAQLAKDPEWLFDLFNVPCEEVYWVDRY